MCGRYAATANPGELVEEFDIEYLDEVGLVSAPRYNIAPTDPVATIWVDDHDGSPMRTLGTSSWGLVPQWRTARPMKLINARVETVNEKPSFKRAIERRRCILPALGYYEWIPEQQGGRTVKQPYFLHPVAGSLAMAGIFEYHRTDAGWVRTTSILTTEATDEFGWVHDRMPMVVPRQHVADWLDPQLTDGFEAVALVTEPRLDRARRVSREVSTVGNDGPQLIESVTE